MARPELSKEYVEESASEGNSISSGEDSSEEETLAISLKLATKSKNGQPRSPEDNSSSNSDDDTSDSGTGAQSEDTRTNGLKRKNRSQESSSPNKKAKSAPVHIPARAYQPPTGYVPLKPDSQSTNLDFSDLSTKQIWHLTVPASVPLRKIKSFNMQAALRGQPILEYHGIKYSFHTTSKSNNTVLLPLTNLVSTGRGSEVTVAYEASEVPISQTLCLREIASVPTHEVLNSPINSSTVSNQLPESLDTEANGVTFFATKVGTKPPPRQQPQGLMKRYHPFGSQINTKEKMHRTEVADSSEDEELDNNHVNGFTIPAALSDDEMDIDTSPKADKKKRSEKKKMRPQDGNEINMLEPPKKSKKNKRSDGENVQRVDREALMPNDATLPIAAKLSSQHKEKKKDKHGKKAKGITKV